MSGRNKNSRAFYFFMRALCDEAVSSQLLTFDQTKKKAGADHESKSNKTKTAIHKVRELARQNWQDRTGKAEIARQK
ncbi:MAG: hypothetical protein IJ147_09250 [Lachnospiraceae bacterium]|nr:hypothetical protein [Lachnospiraceae bacterium]